MSTRSKEVEGRSIEWYSRRLGEIIRLISGQHILKHLVNREGIGMPYITGPADFPSNRIITSKFTSEPQSCCEPGDILVTVKGSGVGKIVQADKAYCISRQLMAIRVDKDCDNGFIYHQLKALTQRISKASAGLIPGISRQDILNLNILMPASRTEQVAIATALSDADELITALEKLIEKKRQIKQGTMQQLLKPKEGWTTNSIRSIARKIIDYRGVTPKKLGLAWGGGEIPALSANNVQMGYIDFDRECYYGSDELYQRWMRDGDCEQNDLLITMEAPLGNVAYIPDTRKYILSQRTILLRPIEDVDKVFLRYLLMEDSFQQILLAHSTGSTAKGIQRRVLETLQIQYPGLQEQRRIAGVLICIDQEIQLLESKLRKYKLLKQGMMEALLTGSIRLTNR